MELLPFASLSLWQCDSSPIKPRDRFVLIGPILSQLIFSSIYRYHSSPRQYTPTIFSTFIHLADPFARFKKKSSFIQGSFTNRHCSLLQECPDHIHPVLYLAQPPSELPATEQQPWSGWDEEPCSRAPQRVVMRDGQALLFPFSDPYFILPVQGLNPLVTLSLL